MCKQILRGQESNKNGNKLNNYVYFFLKKLSIGILKKMTLYNSIWFTFATLLSVTANSFSKTKLGKLSYANTSNRDSTQAEKKQI